MTKPIETPELLSDLIVIVVGNNHCWGKGDTLDEALRNASRPTGYVAYVAKPDTTVSEFDGSLCWTRGFAPKLIMAKGVKKASDGDIVDASRCPYCQKHKRGWRSSDPNALCVSCNRRKVGE